MTEPAAELVEFSIIRKTDIGISIKLSDAKTNRAIDVSGWVARARFRKNTVSPVLFERSTLDGGILNGGTSGYFTIRFRAVEDIPVGIYYADFKAITPDETTLLRIKLSVEESNDNPA